MGAGLLPAQGFAAVADCVGCHDRVTPQAVMDWRNSRHAQEDIGCDGCHKGDHRSERDVANLTTITAQTCGGCHERQMQQFGAGKHAKAWEAAIALPSAHALPMTRGPAIGDCAGCHKIGLKSEAEIERLRAEGSMFGHASCDSCHTRHSFSLLEARQPQACQTCHMGGDHAQWEMYSASKHGVRALLKQNAVLPGNVPAPRCQDCHMAEGNHEVRTPWGFFAVRLPLSGDPQWRADQATILQALGALDPAGQPTIRLETFRDLDLLRTSEQSFAAEQDRMRATCTGCHSGNFAQAELAKGDTMIRESDRLLAEAIRIVAGLYADGVLASPPGATAPFPDLLSTREAPSPIERRLYEMYLQHRMRAVQGTFHQSPDHALWQGWSELVRDLDDIRAMAASLRRREDASR
jgi:hypothetical protein